MENDAPNCKPTNYMKDAIQHIIVTPLGLIADETFYNNLFKAFNSDIFNVEFKNGQRLIKFNQLSKFLEEQLKNNLKTSQLNKKSAFKILKNKITLKNTRNYNKIIEQLNEIMTKFVNNYVTHSKKFEEYERCIRGEVIPQNPSNTLLIPFRTSEYPPLTENEQREQNERGRNFRKRLSEAESAEAAEAAKGAKGAEINRTQVYSLSRMPTPANYKVKPIYSGPLPTNAERTTMRKKRNEYFTRKFKNQPKVEAAAPPVQKPAFNNVLKELKQKWLKNSKEKQLGAPESVPRTYNALYDNKQQKPQLKPGTIFGLNKPSPTPNNYVEQVHINPTNLPTKTQQEEARLARLARFTNPKSGGNRTKRRSKH